MIIAADSRESETHVRPTHQVRNASPQRWRIGRKIEENVSLLCKAAEKPLHPWGRLLAALT
jgi:hypothetical protein